MARTNSSGGGLPYEKEGDTRRKIRIELFNRVQSGCGFIRTLKVSTPTQYDDILCLFVNYIIYRDFLTYIPKRYRNR